MLILRRGPEFADLEGGGGGGCSFFHFWGAIAQFFSKNASKSMICSDSDDLELGSGPRPSPFIYGGSLLSIEVKPVFALADSWKPQRTPHSLAESHRTLPDKCHGE